LRTLLPAPKLDDLDGSTKLDDEEEIDELDVAFSAHKTAPTIRLAPPYLQRRNWQPREVEDFGDGGAFPEIHIPQYPLKMGMSTKITGNTLALEVDETGNVKYDAILTSRMRKGTWVHSSFKDLVEKNVGEEELRKPSSEEIEETTERTKRELEKLVSGRIQSSKATSQAMEASKKSGPTYLRYTPQEAGGTYNSGAKQRVVSLVEAQHDPLEPPKHRHKKVAGGIPSPPPPVQHSPPKKLTVQEQRDWKIPSCISNWKNPKE